MSEQRRNLRMGSTAGLQFVAFGVALLLYSLVLGLDPVWIGTGAVLTLVAGLASPLLPWDRLGRLGFHAQVLCALSLLAVFGPRLTSTVIIGGGYVTLGVFVGIMFGRRALLVYAPIAFVSGLPLLRAVPVDEAIVTTTTTTMLFLASGYMMALEREWSDHQLSTEQAIRHDEVQAILDSSPLAITLKDHEGRVLGVNSAAKDVLDQWGVDSFIGCHLRDYVPERFAGAVEAIDALEQRALAESRALSQEIDADDAGAVALRLTAAPYTLGGEQGGVVTTVENVTETRTMQRALATQGRMESIGQLAAGVAHEINTPVQFVSDNTRFLSSSVRDLIEANTKLAAIAGAADPAAVQRVQDENDTAFISEEAPEAVDQCLEGLARVARIARALKEFSHPSDDVVETDLNHVIVSTVDVSSNEWKYVADVHLELDEGLPPVPCRQGRLKQALLNMIVNAGHAIDDGAEGGAKGTITVATAQVDDQAQITISDSGVGMSAEVKDRIFEQFFTTKEVGRGTGQGLSLAWDVVRSHHGTITVDSAPGRGTTFTIRLPLSGSTTSEPSNADRTSEPGRNLDRADRPDGADPRLEASSSLSS